MIDLCMTCMNNECMENDSPCEKPIVCPCSFCKALEEAAEMASDFDWSPEEDW